MIMKGKRTTPVAPNFVYAKLLQKETLLQPRLAATSAFQCPLKTSRTLGQAVMPTFEHLANIYNQIPVLGGSFNLLCI